MNEDNQAQARLVRYCFCRTPTLAIFCTKTDCLWCFASMMIPRLSQPKPQSERPSWRPEEINDSLKWRKAGKNAMHGQFHLSTVFEKSFLVLAVFTLKSSCSVTRTQQVGFYAYWGQYSIWSLLWWFWSSAIFFRFIERACQNDTMLLSYRPLAYIWHFSSLFWYSSPWLSLTIHTVRIFRLLSPFNSIRTSCFPRNRFLVETVLHSRAARSGLQVCVHIPMAWLQ